MKPLMTLTLYSRDPMDPETLTKVGIIGFETIGEGQIILSRDEMGTIVMESCDIKPLPDFVTLIDETTKTLSELHAKLGEAHIATNHAMSDMFAVHKWLTR